MEETEDLIFANFFICLYFLVTALALRSLSSLMISSLISNAKRSTSFLSFARTGDVGFLSVMAFMRALIFPFYFLAYTFYDNAGFCALGSTWLIIVWGIEKSDLEHSQTDEF